jgi:hypothetical protein
MSIFNFSVTPAPVVNVSGLNEINIDVNYLGIQGFTGSQGVIGLTGSQGVIGFTGSQGVIGFTGSQGVIGLTGSQGEIGFTGSQGEIGFTGSQGEIGFTGSQGVIGFTGSQGEIGFTGSQGGIGLTGSQGGIGFTGSQGEIGFTGSQGVQGVIGFTGSVGLTGSQGIQGVIGFTGSSGSANNISYDNTTSELLANNVQDAIDEVVVDTTDAINKAHDQNTDTKLAEGTANEVTAAEIRTFLDTPKGAAVPRYGEILYGEEGDVPGYVDTGDTVAARRILRHFDLQWLYELGETGTLLDFTTTQVYSHPLPKSSHPTRHHRSRRTINLQSLLR